MEEWVKQQLQDRRGKRAAGEEGRKVEAYHALGDSVELQQYLRSHLTLGAKLKFKFRAGSHGLEEEVGRRVGQARECRTCRVCGQGEIENVSHFLWSCPRYEDARSTFLASLSCVTTKQMSCLMLKDLQEGTSLVLS